MVAQVLWFFFSYALVGLELAIVTFLWFAVLRQAAVL
jgi:hypothetical protein